MSSSAESGLSHTHILGKPMFSLLLQATWTHPSNSFVVCLNNHAHANKYITRAVATLDNYFALIWHSRQTFLKVRREQGLTNWNREQGKALVNPCSLENCIGFAQIHSAFSRECNQRRRVFYFSQRIVFKTHFKYSKVGMQLFDFHPS